MNGDDFTGIVTTAPFGRPDRGVAWDPVDQKVYWIVGKGSEGYRIQRANPDGTLVEDLVLGFEDEQEGGLAIDPAARTLYWCHGSVIYRANLDGSNPEVVRADVGCNGIALDVSAGKIYRNGGVIDRSNLDGTNVETLIESDPHNPEGIALDLLRGKMYWVEHNAGAIRRANLDGSDPETILTGQTAPVGIAVLSKCGQVYWTNATGGTIRRANLDGTNAVDVLGGLRFPAGLAIGVIEPGP